jgi:hypothetical protein
MSGRHQDRLPLLTCLPVPNAFIKNESFRFFLLYICLFRQGSDEETNQSQRRINNKRRVSRFKYFQRIISFNLASIS